MTNYRTKTKEYNPLEVKFAKHQNEFFRFYERHKKICDEISGIKDHIMMENGVPKPIKITRSNFDFAIKSLEAFFIDNVHYIRDTQIRAKLEWEIDKLHQDFLNDIEYFDFVRREKSLSDSEEIKFKIKYFNYLLRCFDMSYEISKSLQDSIMVSTADVKKSIIYSNTIGFFDQLSEYRDEVTNNLSNFRFKTLLIHFKKVIGYFYTYKVFINKTDLEKLNYLVNLVFNYIIKEDIMKLVRLANKETISYETIDKIRKESFIIKKALSKIYILTNESLSARNILPKVKRKIYIDVTLI